MGATSDAFDLSAYLSRIGSPPVGGPDSTTLFRLHRAHLAAIPFENLDVQMGRGIELDPASLQAALVGRRRGGYCFQQNGLFRLALTALGFAPRARGARVRLEATAPVTPRTHMALVVPLDGVEWLADVGFGAAGIVEPLALDGAPVVQDGWGYRTRRDGELRVLQREDRSGWTDLYVFADDDVPQIDYVVGNWYTSTHPDSRFVRTLTAQRMLGDMRHVVRNLSYGLARNGGDWEIRELARAELVPLLRDVFELDVPPDARFRALDGPADPAG